MDHSNHGGATGTAAAAGHTSHGMIPYLHFTGGDYLFFKAWQPHSPAAIAGACLGLVVLSLMERWLAATRGAFAVQWRRKALALAAARDQPALLGSASSPSDIGTPDKPVKLPSDVQELGRESLLAPNQRKSSMLPRTRTIPPFILAHDVPRGALYALQALLGYVLMLAVMTYQAVFLISILAGLGIGEIFFGRLVTESHMH